MKQGTLYDHDKKPTVQNGDGYKESILLRRKWSSIPMCYRIERGDQMIKPRKTAALRCGSVHGVHDDNN